MLVSRMNNLIQLTASSSDILVPNWAQLLQESKYTVQYELPFPSQGWSNVGINTLVFSQNKFLQHKALHSNSSL
jgi:hypothetical protein